jgi:hypothetical protein
VTLYVIVPISWTMSGPRLVTDTVVSFKSETALTPSAH